MKKRSSYNPRNWSEYNKAKINSGNIFIYFKDDITDWWYNTESNGKKGRNNLYSNQSIELASSCIIFSKYRYAKRKDL